MSDSQLFFIGPKNRGGRPKAPEPRSSVSTWIPASRHDQLVRLAKQRGVSVSAVVRGLIAGSLSKPKDAA